MEIIHLKKKLKDLVHSDQTHKLVPAENAWQIFKSLLDDPIDGEFYEEFGFEVGLFQADDIKYLQIYFGRLIDAEIGQNWRTAEINFYYRYEMTVSLNQWLSLHSNSDFETAYCLSESEDEIQKKRRSVCDFVEQHISLWDQVRGMSYEAKTYYQFWII